MHRVRGPDGRFAMQEIPVERLVVEVESLIDETTPKKKKKKSSTTLSQDLDA